MSDQYPPSYSGGQQYGAPPPHGGQQYGSPTPSSGQQYGAPYGAQQYGNSQQGGQQYDSGQPYGSGQQYGSGPYGGDQQYGSSSPQPQMAAPVTTAPPKKPIGRKLAGFAAVIAVALVVALLKFGLFSGISSALGVGDDKTAEAKAGDCIAQLPEVAEGQEREANNAKVVKCDSADAKFSVLGRIENQTETQVAKDEVCNAYPEAEYRYSSIPVGGKGYVLCLKELKPAKKS